METALSKLAQAHPTLVRGEDVFAVQKGIPNGNYLQVRNQRFALARLGTLREMQMGWMQSNAFLQSSTNGEDRAFQQLVGEARSLERELKQRSSAPLELFLRQTAPSFYLAKQGQAVTLVDVLTKASQLTTPRQNASSLDTLVGDLSPHCKNDGVLLWLNQVFDLVPGMGDEFVMWKGLPYTLRPSQTTSEFLDAYARQVTSSKNSEQKVRALRIAVAHLKKDIGSIPTTTAYDTIHDSVFWVAQNTRSGLTAYLKLHPFKLRYAQKEYYFREVTRINILTLPDISFVEEFVLARA